MSYQGMSAHKTFILFLTLIQVFCKNFSHHIESNIFKIYASFVEEFSRITQKNPAYEVHGGSQCENLALQNIQARSRMVLAFLLAQLIPWSQGNKGSLLVLGSSNVDEALRGYFTKYDCSSADLNPIGSISKADLRAAVRYLLETDRDFSVLSQFLDANPTAELVPTSETYQQSDEVFIGYIHHSALFSGIFLSVLVFISSLKWVCLMTNCRCLVACER